MMLSLSRSRVDRDMQWQSMTAHAGAFSSIASGIARLGRNAKSDTLRDKVGRLAALAGPRRDGNGDESPAEREVKRRLWSLCQKGIKIDPVVKVPRGKKDADSLKENAENLDSSEKLELLPRELDRYRESGVASEQWALQEEMEEAMPCQLEPCHVPTESIPEQLGYWSRGEAEGSSDQWVLMGAIAEDTAAALQLPSYHAPGEQALEEMVDCQEYYGSYVYSSSTGFEEVMVPEDEMSCSDPISHGMVMYGQSGGVYGDNGGTFEEDGLIVYGQSEEIYGRLHDEYGGSDDWLETAMEGGQHLVFYSDGGIVSLEDEPMSGGGDDYAEEEGEAEEAEYFYADGYGNVYPLDGRGDIVMPASDGLESLLGDEGGDFGAGEDWDTVD